MVSDLCIPPPFAAKPRHGSRRNPTPPILLPILQFVTLLRLSPLLPLAASNYLYGLTSVDLGSYVAGSFLGMLPGTYAYVTTGHLGKAALMDGEGSLGVESWQVGGREMAGGGGHGSDGDGGSGQLLTVPNGRVVVR